ncbi:conserved hypothetical protein [Deferribacter desulfuricans SSM1]|uniref:Multi antimicrobial extrusion protein MatE n=1 Tax=Deferribacter desulfuricans (strain DSM 14783 / JCM 11476 / NBRC 101012 / SSM1) TaxID=639282 RepID=D3PE77_DEFDS|nr:hypothetical protein [Deferribacter desulfuricans]BAI80900.1 conserved hypothetical protein [Deferribacter desulfuricans SSM1]
MKNKNLTYTKIFKFWFPLASTWIMMSLEGPILAAIIARLPNEKINLAAYGIALAFGLILESPIIMIMAAATALIKDRESYTKLRNFTMFLNFAITICILVLLLPQVFSFVGEKLIGLTEPVYSLTYNATMFLLPWPGAIGYRRLYQGVLIVSNKTKFIAYSTIVRLLSNVSTAILLYKFTHLNGAYIGTIALSTGVIFEALAVRIMAHNSIKAIKSKISNEEPLTYKFISKYYYPLALTPFIALSSQPIVTFFLGKSIKALESLAVMPVVYSLTFIFRSIGLSYQEVIIALTNNYPDQKNKIRNFAILLAITTTSLLFLITATPFSNFYFIRLSGLSEELANFAKTPALIMSIMPALTLLLTYQRSEFIMKKVTFPITIGTVIEVGGIITVIYTLINLKLFVGAICAASSFVSGRLMANIYFFIALYFLLRKRNSDTQKETT